MGLAALNWDSNRPALASKADKTGSIWVRFQRCKNTSFPSSNITTYYITTCCMHDQKQPRWVRLAKCHFWGLPLSSVTAGGEVTRCVCCSLGTERRQPRDPGRLTPASCPPTPGWVLHRPHRSTPRTDRIPHRAVLSCFVKTSWPGLTRGAWQEQNNFRPQRYWLLLCHHFGHALPGGALVPMFVVPLT